jgi:hypothetical protein
VFAVGLHRPGQAQHLGLVDPVADDTDDTDDRVLALGQRAGLVEQVRFDALALLEREAILDEDAVAGRQRG